MEPNYLIDTNSVIDYLDNKLPDNANRLIDNILSSISVITRMELLSWPGANESQTDILKLFISGTEVYSLDESVIQKAIEIRKKYKTKLPDAIIAATAIVNSFILVSRNTKDFKYIDDLNLLNPYEL